MSNDHKPQRKFMGAAGLPSIDLYGPEALKDDLDDINAMFNPNAEHKNGNPGGIGKDNLKFRFEDTDFAWGIGTSPLQYLQNVATVAGQLAKIVEKLQHHDDLIDRSQWMMMMDIDENGHLVYEQVHGLPVDFEIDGNGHLNVEVVTA